MTHPKKVWHKDEKGWHSLIMEAVDANHAVNVDPANWAFERPAEPEPEPTIVESTVAAFMPGVVEPQPKIEVEIKDGFIINMDDEKT